MWTSFNGSSPVCLLQSSYWDQKNASKCEPPFMGHHLYVSFDLPIEIKRRPPKCEPPLMGHHLYVPVEIKRRPPRCEPPLIRCHLYVSFHLPIEIKRRPPKCEPPLMGHLFYVSFDLPISRAQSRLDTFPPHPVGKPLVRKGHNPHTWAYKHVHKHDWSTFV